jgi:hypothetical protein
LAGRYLVFPWVGENRPELNSLDIFPLLSSFQIAPEAQIVAAPEDEAGDLVLYGDNGVCTDNRYVPFLFNAYQLPLQLNRSTQTRTSC